jgi:hypothetical protein
MSYSAYWKFVDELTVAEATALWCGVEPERIPQTTPLNVPNFHAIKRMLSDAIRSEKLPAKLAPTARVLDDYSTSSISRANLMTWAKSIGELPAFLFDTLMDVSEDWSGMDETGTVSASPVPDEPSTITRFSYIRSDIGQAPKTSTVEPEKASVENEAAEPIEPLLSNTKNPGGRPRKHDWNGAVIEIIRIADTDCLPRRRSELKEMICQWFLNKYGKEPASSEVSKLVGLVYGVLESGGWQPQDGAPEPILKTSKG